MIAVTEVAFAMTENGREVNMPVLVIAVVFFVLFLTMGLLATVAVVSETRAMQGSIFLNKRARNLPRV